MKLLPKQSPFPFYSLLLGVLLAVWIMSVFAEGTPEYYYPDPDISTNGRVRALMFYEGRLYVGGSFTEVTDAAGTHDRTDLAAYDTSTWLVTDFTANTDRGTVRAIAAGGGRLFVGGSFSRINGESCSKLAALDPVSGAVITDFRENGGAIDGEVWALAVSGNRLYLGGSFAWVDGYERSYLASMDITGGAIDERFNPAPSDPFDDSGRTAPGVWALETHPGNPDIIFVGGNFQTIAGSDEVPFLAALHSDGTLGPKFVDNLFWSPILALDACGTLLCAGGGGFSNRVLAYYITAEPYERVWRSIRAQGDIQAVACAPQGYVFFGCHDGLFDSTDDYRMGVLNANTGEIHDAYPPMNSFFGVRALATDGECCAAGGEFTRMNGVSQTYLALFRKLPFDRSLILAPASPELVDPRDGEIAVPNAPVLSWKHAARALTYDVQLSVDQQFSVLHACAGSLTESHIQCSGLADVARYRWRVRAYNEGGASDWSTSNEFITAPGLRDIPAVAAPIDGRDDLPVAINLCWHPTASAISYTVQLSDASDSTIIIFDRDGLIDTNFTVAGLANNTAYLWRINARTAGGTTGWASAYFRTMVTGPQVPRCTAPCNNAVQVKRQPALRWLRTGGAVSYRVQVAADPLFTAVIYDTADVTDTSVVASALAEDTRYFWRVGAQNAGGSMWSLSMQFTTIFPVPSAPMQLFPDAGAVLTADSLRFIWQKSAPHVTRYRIEIAGDSIMLGSLFDSITVDTEYIRYNLDNETGFWWRISAGNETGWGLSSQSRFFSVAIPAAPQRRFSLDWFAFSGRRCSVGYSVAQPCDVSMEFFDLRGNMVWNMRRTGREPGSYTESIPSRRLPAGTYLIYLRAGGFTAAADAVIVR